MEIIIKEATPELYISEFPTEYSCYFCGGELIQTICGHITEEGVEVERVLYNCETGLCNTVIKYDKSSLPIADISTRNKNYTDNTPSQNLRAFNIMQDATIDESQLLFTHGLQEVKG